MSDANRAKWSTATMASRSCWSGSALLGGWLVDKIGYRNTFLLPLGMHLASMLCLTPLLRTVRSGAGRKDAEPMLPRESDAEAPDMSCLHRGGGAEPAAPSEASNPNRS